MDSTRDFGAPSRAGRAAKILKTLVGSGDKIALSTLPFVIAGFALQFAAPSVLSIPGSDPLTLLGAVLLMLGLIAWAWSAVLILTKVPGHELITSGPFALVKHPLYTGVALLVLPGLGLLLGNWLGPLFGVVLYVMARVFARDEERDLAAAFGPAWEDYARSVRFPWI